MKSNIRIALTLALAALASSAGLSLSAAEVSARLSTPETYVGQPVTLQIHVSGASQVDPPSIPDVDGLKISALGAPSRSMQITTINGQTTTRTSLTFVYEVTPQRSGSFLIPPITLHVNGRDQRTGVLEVVASKSETGDLLFAEIAGKEKEIYVGQSLDLTLRIWLRPYRDRQHNITLSEGDMWKMISDRTTWGPFADRLQQLADNGQRPAGKEVLRKDGDGNPQSYYLYEINSTIYPKRPGTIDADDVKVVVQYPIALGKARSPFGELFDDMPGGRSGFFGDDEAFSPFGSQLTVRLVRPIVAVAQVDPIRVLPVPTADRPSDYRGAVGKYVIAAQASPTTVKAGDPINLLIGISGTGPMEFVEAPPLADLAELTADFKVPNEPLAGFVKGDRKLFSTSIRPRRAGVAQIPAIPFSFFDPAAKKFVTVHSDPISIKVDPAEMLALNDVTGAGAKAGAHSRTPATSRRTRRSPRPRWRSSRVTACWRISRRCALVGGRSRSY